MNRISSQCFTPATVSCFTPTTTQDTNSVPPSPPPLFISKNEAATSIQKIFRGYQEKKSFLPKSLYPHYVEQCKNTETKFMSMSTDGKTPVYLPEDLPEVVLKKSGRKKAIFRFQQTQQVKSILKSENCSHLIIPKVNLYEEFLIEERLPIDTSDQHNMSLYERNKELFNEPVREMVRLFSKSHIPCLTSWRFNKSTNTAYVEDTRYDNLPFYIVNKKGKQQVMIGLIDLERAGTYEEASHEHRLFTLTVIFPYHKNIIKNEADKLSMHYNPLHLETASRIGLTYLTKNQTRPITGSSGRSFIPTGTFKETNS